MMTEPASLVRTEIDLDREGMALIPGAGNVRFRLYEVRLKHDPRGSNAPRICYHVEIGTRTVIAGSLVYDGDRPSVSSILAVEARRQNHHRRAV